MLTINDKFVHNNISYVTHVFHESDSPLTYRYEVHRLGENPAVVHTLARCFEDHPEMGHPNPGVDPVIAAEFPSIREEFINTLSSQTDEQD